MNLSPVGVTASTGATPGTSVCGKGWETGSRQNIDYSANYNPSGNSYLCVYGWTTDPLVEYYIIEDYGSYKPGDSYQGTHTTDGSTYEIYTSERVDKPSIEGGMRRSPSTGAFDRTRERAGPSRRATTSTPGRTTV